MSTTLSIMVLVSVLVSNPDAARAADRPEPSEALTREIAACARRLVQDRHGGLDGVAGALRLLNVARAQAADARALATTLESCRDLLITLPSQPKVSRASQFAYAKSLPSESCPAKAVLEDLIRPVVSCKRGGPGASAGVALALGLEVTGAKCDASDGRSWLELSVIGGIGFGLGGELDVTIATDAFNLRRRDAGHDPFSTSTGLSKAAALMAGEKGEWENVSSTFGEIDNFTPDRAGLPFGLGFTALRTGQLNVEVVPLPTDIKRVAAKLRESESQCEWREEQPVARADRPTGEASARMAALESDPSADKGLAGRAESVAARPVPAEAAPVRAL